MGDNLFTDDLTRREAIKTALKGAAYAAPVILSAAVPGVASAASPPGSGLTGKTVTGAYILTGTTDTPFTLQFLGSFPNATPPFFGGPQVTNGPKNSLLDIYLAPYNANGSPPTGGFVFLIGGVPTDVNGNALVSSRPTATLPTSAAATNHRLYAIAVPSGSPGIPGNAVAAGQVDEVRAG